MIEDAGDAANRTVQRQQRNLPRRSTGPMIDNVAHQLCERQDEGHVVTARQREICAQPTLSTRADRLPYLAGTSGWLTSLPVVSYTYASTRL